MHLTRVRTAGGGTCLREKQTRYVYRIYITFCVSSRRDAAIHVIKEGDVEYKLCIQGSKQGNACDLDLLEGWDVTVRAAPVLCVGRVFYLCRVTSLMRNGTQLGRY